MDPASTTIASVPKECSSSPALPVGGSNDCTVNALEELFQGGQDAGFIAQSALKKSSRNISASLQITAHQATPALLQPLEGSKVPVYVEAAPPVNAATAPAGSGPKNACNDPPQGLDGGLADGHLHKDGNTPSQKSSEPSKEDDDIPGTTYSPVQAKAKEEAQAKVKTNAVKEAERAAKQKAKEEQRIKALADKQALKEAKAAEKEARVAAAREALEARGATRRRGRRSILNSASQDGSLDPVQNEDRGDLHSAVAPRAKDVVDGKRKAVKKRESSASEATAAKDTCSENSRDEEDKSSTTKMIDANFTFSTKVVPSSREIKHPFLRELPSEKETEAEPKVSSTNVNETSKTADQFKEVVSATSTSVPPTNVDNEARTGAEAATLSGKDACSEKVRDATDKLSSSTHMTQANDDFGAKETEAEPRVPSTTKTSRRADQVEKVVSVMSTSMPPTNNTSDIVNGIKDVDNGIRTSAEATTPSAKDARSRKVRDAEDELTSSTKMPEANRALSAKEVDSEAKVSSTNEESKKADQVMEDVNTTSKDTTPISTSQTPTPIKATAADISSGKRAEAKVLSTSASSATKAATQATNEAQLAAQVNDNETRTEDDFKLASASNASDSKSEDQDMIKTGFDGKSLEEEASTMSATNASQVKVTDEDKANNPSHDRKPKAKVKSKAKAKAKAESRVISEKRQLPVSHELPRSARARHAPHVIYDPSTHYRPCLKCERVAEYEVDDVVWFTGDKRNGLQGPWPARVIGVLDHSNTFRYEITTFGAEGPGNFSVTAKYLLPWGGDGKGLADAVSSAQAKWEMARGIKRKSPDG
eukprot:gnl/MRDRNA2_/MRDRNA2_77161_c0_seq1.p1 gnl/MRDRNA2_/MRDRNA2_77161_c0~~gnl/MRDRNA2_/MRDRNA2_77161_c0_seq1.p1  ORF type:complete len:869 (+),score=225.09 gnl/MRDRNA2_/MRDRNA2_77161_c0_seq1:142-2607(+)